MFSSLLLTINSTNTSAEQVLNNGFCNIQLQGNGNTAGITCFLAQAFPPFPNTSNPQYSNSVELLAQVKGLQHNSNSFTLLFNNLNPDQTLSLSTRNFSINDDLGNNYQLDDWAMFDLTLRKIIPPNSKIQIPYVLATPINPNATKLTFTIESIWTQPIQSPFRVPLPLIQWTIQL